MKRFLAPVLLGLLLTSSMLFAQGRTGTLQIEIQDQEGGRLPGTTITASAEDVLGERVAVTDANGVATLAGLAPSSQYIVTSSLDGFNGSRNENVLIKTGQTTSIQVSLTLSSIEEELIVTGESPIVDVTSAISGQDITLELTEALPTGRSYQSYLQLVPGVLPTDPTVRGQNPAVKGGLNYRDINGDLGVSRDNFYYLEGIDVTDPVQGTFGANMNTEIIQEQSVMTGGIPAEFVGAPGLVTNVVTKSGGNKFSGSLNYFTQSDSLVADNKNAADDSFSTFDTAITLGGPILQDKAWFFGSFRQTELESDIIELNSTNFLRTVKEESDQGFIKLSWALSQKDTITGTFLSDPATLDGSLERNIRTNRSVQEDTGGDRYIVNYSRVFGSGFLELGAGKHEGEASQFAADQSTRNNVIFRAIDQGTFTLADEQLGGDGSNSIDERDNEFVKASFDYFFSTGWGDHSIKVGGDFKEHISFRDSNTTGDGGSYTSIDARYLANNITAGEVAASGGFTEVAFDVTNASDFNGLITGINASANRASHYAALDLDGDGTITQTEMATALIFNDTTGNPNGKINYDRTFQTSSGPQELSSEGTTFYVQDTIQTGKFTFNVGVRAEKYEHFATTGANIFTFDWEYAPRVSVVYDLFGSGRQKISGYYGRYYDPIRNNMTQFAGTLTGRVREEQAFVNGEWVTFRTRGGDVVQDAFFSPTTKTPYTDDFALAYQIDLGKNMSFEANYTIRETRDILEDYDLSIYALKADGTTDYPGDINDPDSLFLGLGYFGYTVNPGSNFVIATLAGGKRDWNGLELVFRKRYSNRWQALSSFTIADGDGNTNSDSNADFQGDDLVLDPRAPNMFGTQPGLIKQLLKLAGSYHWDNGIQLGGAYRWNSGTVTNLTELRSRRNLPIRGQAGDIVFAGINTERWVQPNTVGALENDSWGTLDLRVQYNRNFGFFDGEVFVDAFNVFDEQSAVRNQDLLAGTGATTFGQGIQFVPPRRFFLGVRVGF